jgi:hypothetical protein
VVCWSFFHCLLINNFNMDSNVSLFQMHFTYKKMY